MANGDRRVSLPFAQSAGRPGVVEVTKLRSPGLGPLDGEGGLSRTTYVPTTSGGGICIRKREGKALANWGIEQ